MRISDWSSDVCSSDLVSGLRGGRAQSLRDEEPQAAGEEARHLLASDVLRRSEGAIGVARDDARGREAVDGGRVDAGVVVWERVASLGERRASTMGEGPVDERRPLGAIDSVLGAGPAIGVAGAR